MEKILVVEDNKTLAKLIAKKITHELNMDVDVAYNMAEAKLFIKTYKYFLVLADLNLPDAPDGEVVDYALSKNSRVIVLSGSVDKELRKKLLKKSIIDYIKKSGANDINYIIQSVKRLQKNLKHKVLVVDDSMILRKELKEMLENLCFEVLTVAHGEEAIGMLNTHKDISMVVTDYNMPVMNGLELTLEIRKTRSKNELCLIAISSNDDDEITAMFLKQGANDYIKKPFSKEEFSCRINNSIESLENIHAVLESANRDFLTGLHNRRYFFEDMETYFLNSAQSSEKFAIAMIDIDNFKYINDTYGHEIGDKVIIHLCELITKHITHKNIIARFGGEEFCVVLKNIKPDDATVIFETLVNKVENTPLVFGSEKISYTISIGLSTKHDFSLDGSINQADVLLYNAKEEGKNQVMHN